MALITDLDPQSPLTVTLIFSDITHPKALIRPNHKFPYYL